MVLNVRLEPGGRRVGIFAYHRSNLEGPGATEEGEMTIAAAHFRAGRQLLGWSQSRLAGQVGVSESAVAYIERVLRPAASQVASRIQSALEEAGVEFTNGGEPGVKLRKAK
jgi:DNA-binding XRE family transcriptional regulator